MQTEKEWWQEVNEPEKSYAGPETQIENARRALEWARGQDATWPGQSPGLPTAIEDLKAALEGGDLGAIKNAHDQIESVAGWVLHR